MTTTLSDKITSAEKPKIAVHLVAIQICQPCLDGEGQECHTPGCSMFLHRVDLPFHEGIYTILHHALGGISGHAD